MEKIYERKIFNFTYIAWTKRTTWTARFIGSKWTTRTVRRLFKNCTQLIFLNTVRHMQALLVCLVLMELLDCLAIQDNLVLQDQLDHPVKVVGTENSKSSVEFKQQIQACPLS